MRIRTPLRTCVQLSLGLGVLLSNAQAQVSYTLTGARAFDWSPSHAGDVGRVTTGMYTENARLGAMVLDDQGPVLQHSPATYRSYFDCGGPAVLDMDTLRLPTWSVDGLATVGPTGLTFARYHSGQWLTETLPHTAYNHASLVRAGDLDGDGVPGVAAIHSTGNQLILGVNAAAATRPSPSLISLTGPALALVVADTHVSPGDEVVVFQNNGVATFDSAGNSISFLPTTAMSQAIPAVFRQAGYGFDRIAVVVRGTQSSAQMLVVLGGPAEPALMLGATDVYAMHAADTDLDGDDELVALTRGLDQITILYNLSNVEDPDVDTTFALGAAASIPAGGRLALPNQAGFACQDFDSDGDPDLLIFGGQADGMLLASGSQILAEERKVTSVMTSGGGDLSHCVTATPMVGLMRLKLLSPLAHLSGATHIEVTAWRFASNEDYFEGLALKPSFTPWVPGSPDGQDAWVRLVDYDQLAHYFLEAREVTRDASGAVVAAGPIWAGRLSAFLESHAGEQTVTVYPHHTCDETTQLLGMPPSDDGNGNPDEKDKDSGVTPLPDPPDPDPAGPPVFT